MVTQLLGASFVAFLQGYGALIESLVLSCVFTILVSLVSIAKKPVHMCRNALEPTSPHRHPLYTHHTQTLIQLPLLPLLWWFLPTQFFFVLCFHRALVYLAAIPTFCIPFIVVFSVARDIDFDDPWNLRPVPTVAGSYSPARWVFLTDVWGGRIPESDMCESWPDPGRWFKYESLPWSHLQRELQQEADAARETIREMDERKRREKEEAV